MTPRVPNIVRSHIAADRRQAERFAAELAKHYRNDPAKLERHARLLDALDPGVAEAVRAFRLPGKGRAA